MNIKRYIVQDMQEAMGKIRTQLGPDAVILNSRTIRKKGVAGLFSKPLLEVVVAYDSEPREAGAQKKAPATPSAAASAAPGRDPAAEAPPPAPANPAQGEKLTEMEKKLEEMTCAMQEIAQRLRGKVSAQYTPEIQKQYARLIDQEVEESIARSIAEEAQDICQKRQADPVEAFEQVVTNRLGEPVGMRLHRFKRTVAVFVGPTGAGKTTTIAKLAARYALNEKAKVGLITADAYRIAAHEQIKTYADILELPLKTVYRPEEIAQALSELDNVDIVLVDTPGKSPKDTAHQEEILAMIQQSGASEVYLVISASTGYRSCAMVAEQYSFLKDYKMLFTKMDETPTTGCLINARSITGRPLSYITAGQSVPDDIELLDVTEVTAQLVGKEA